MRCSTQRTGDDGSPGVGTPGDSSASAPMDHGVHPPSRGLGASVQPLRSITQLSYAPVPTGPTMPDLSQISLPGAMAANSHRDLQNGRL